MSSQPSIDLNTEDYTQDEHSLSLQESAQNHRTYDIAFPPDRDSMLFNIISQMDQLVSSIETGIPQASFYHQIYSLEAEQPKEDQRIENGSFSKTSQMESEENNSANTQKQESEKKNFPKFFIGDVIRVLNERKDIQQKNQSCDITNLSYLQFAAAKLNEEKKLQSLREILEPGLQDKKIVNSHKKFMKKDKKNKKRYVNSIQDMIEEFDPKDFKKKVKEIILQSEDNLIQMARNRQIKEQKRKAMFIVYVADYLHNLRDNRIRRKGKQTKRQISQ